MKVLKIIRFKSTSEGTFGVIFDMNKIGEWIPFALTLERQWRNNERGKSCIPKGEYLNKRSRYEKGGYESFEVICPPRELVKYHKGNIDDDSNGCILIGEMFDEVWKEQGGVGVLVPGIVASAKGFQEFMYRLKDESQFKLVIEEV